MTNPPKEAAKLPIEHKCINFGESVVVTSRFDANRQSVIDPTNMTIMGGLDRRHGDDLEPPEGGRLPIRRHRSGAGRVHLRQAPHAASHPRRKALEL